MFSCVCSDVSSPYSVCMIWLFVGVVVVFVVVVPIPFHLYANSHELSVLKLFSTEIFNWLFKRWNEINGYCRSGKRERERE